MALGKLLQQWEGSGAQCFDTAMAKSLATTGPPEAAEGVSDAVGGVAVRGVLACSALRRDYRRILSSGGRADCDGSKVNCVFVVLNGSEALIRERMSVRSHHFFPEGLIWSQFDTFELPNSMEGHRFVVVDISLPLESIVENIAAELSLKITPELQQ